ncbi:SHOCT domain-containing protein [Jatrophihabitans cynanchi]|uniref:SHOCT domain-containing protein n=1 Tax=Jatrophihabitans cynanchi TaxID=2944128 RepID=A0ABY7JYG1_9ACTN|nr:SHOCT domain-containing protein [Jatrophihabitans sp. SB3-54]WAX56698.1 SHOCT domain-containing protein [Jatrophihabitans sp. SB3-54]
MLIFWSAVAAGIVHTVRGARREHPAEPGAQTPVTAQNCAAQRTLDERFARGEIDEDEYRRRRDELALS